jgi:hypothetical protein
MLTVDNLLKHYAGAERNVFDGISFDVPKGARDHRAIRLGQIHAVEVCGRP